MQHRAAQRREGEGDARGATAILSAQIVRGALSLVGTALLSRLLPPASFGIFAMVNVIVSLADILRDMGLTLAVVRTPNATHAQRSNVFWLNLAAGTILSALLFVSAPLVAGLYHEPRVVDLARFMSPIFFINAATAQFRVELMRDNRFTYMSFIDVLSQFVGIASGVVAALVVHNSYSFAVQLVASAIFTMVAVIGGAGWLPSGPDRATRVGRFLRFGVGVSLGQIVNFVAGNVDNVVVGRYLGAKQLGLYSRAYQISYQPMQLVVEPLTNIVVQRLARRRRGSKRDYVSEVVRVERLVLFGICPVIVTVAIGSEPMVDIMLGADWTGATPILRVLALATLCRAFGRVYTWLFAVDGRARLQLWSSVWSEGPSIILILAATPWGMRGIITAVTVRCVLEWVVPAAYASRLPFGVAPVNLVALRFLAGSLAVAAMVAPLQARLVTLNPVLDLLILAVAVVVLECALLSASQVGRGILAEVSTVVRRIITSSRSRFCA